MMKWALITFFFFFWSVSSFLLVSCCKTMRKITHLDCIANKRFLNCLWVFILTSVVKNNNSFLFNVFNKHLAKIFMVSYKENPIISYLCASKSLWGLLNRTLLCWGEQTVLYNPFERNPEASTIEIERS